MSGSINDHTGDVTNSSIRDSIMTTTILDEAFVAELKALSGPDCPEFFAKQIGLFSRRARELLGALRAGAAAADAAAVEKAAHALAGSAANVGARRLTALCRYVEAQCAKPGSAAKALAGDPGLQGILAAIPDELAEVERLLVLESRDGQG
jgi:HPt (histidine-containing phosphotransfer) domain-containing protein